MRNNIIIICYVMEIKIKCFVKSNLSYNDQIKHGISAYEPVNEVHQNDTISRILWYSDWLYNTASAGNSIFCNQSQYNFRRKKYYVTYQTTIEYDKMKHGAIRSEEPYS